MPGSIQSALHVVIYLILKKNKSPKASTVIIPISQKQKARHRRSPERAGM